MNTGAMSKLPWRNAASMIIVARSQSKKVAASASFDYEILMLRRSAKSKFMPNAYVFPGGVVASPQDFDTRWKEIIKHNAGGNRTGEEVVIRDPSLRRPLLMSPESKESGSSSSLPRDIAFRICALRETFEESGILLHTKLTDGTTSNKIPEQDLMKWRPLVHDDPAQFLKMCQEFEVCPDIWSPYEWSDWLTPLGRNDPGQRRFDTLFFTSFVNKEYLPKASLDDKEITDVHWTDPQTILGACLEEKLWLAPPQVYELTRMGQYKSAQSLEAVCRMKREQGCETWLPVFRKCKDGTISCLPGDELYPSQPDYKGLENPPPKVDLTMEEMNLKHPRANRMAIYSKNRVIPFVTVSEEKMVVPTTT